MTEERKPKFKTGDIVYQAGHTENPYYCQGVHLWREFGVQAGEPKLCCEPYEDWPHQEWEYEWVVQDVKTGYSGIVVCESTMAKADIVLTPEQELDLQIDRKVASRMESKAPYRVVT